MAMMVFIKIAGQTRMCVCVRERNKHRHILRQKADSSESHDQSISPHGRPSPLQTSWICWSRLDLPGGRIQFILLNENIVRAVVFSWKGLLSSYSFSLSQCLATRKMFLQGHLRKPIQSFQCSSSSALPLWVRWWSCSAPPTVRCLPMFIPLA